MKFISRAAGSPELLNGLDILRNEEPKLCYQSAPGEQGVNMS